MKAVLYLAAMLIASCAPHAPVIRLGQFQVYADRLKAEATLRNKPFQVKDLVIVLTDINLYEIIGDCTLSDDDSPTISIDRTFWNSADYYERELLLFHELGHCVLDYPHFDNSQAIMNTYMMNGSAYARFRSYYLDDFFSHI